MPFATNDGVRIHYIAEGSGPALLLGHGFTSNTDMWRMASFYDELKSRFTVIPFDARGHGQSDKPHDSDSYSIENRVGDALAVLDAAGFETANFFGYSMGGWLGYLLAINAGDRFGRFVIGASSLLFDDWSERRKMLALGTDGYIAEMLKLDPNMPPESIERAKANDLEALIAVQFDRPDLTEEIPRITRPILAYAGDADPKYDKFAKTAELIPSARMITIRGADHGGGFMETPQILGELLQFLGSDG